MHDLDKMHTGKKAGEISVRKAGKAARRRALLFALLLALGSCVSLPAYADEADDSEIASGVIELADVAEAGSSQEGKASADKSSSGKASGQASDGEDAVASGTVEAEDPGSTASAKDESKDSAKDAGSAAGAKASASVSESGPLEAKGAGKSSDASAAESGNASASSDDDVDREVEAEYWLEDIDIQQAYDSSDEYDPGQEVVNYATQFLGHPYRYGGTSLTNGADCSGFVKSVYANFGVSLPHSSADLRSVGYNVGSLSSAIPGDIVCYPGHVGIYAGSGKIINALNSKSGIVFTNAAYNTILAVRRIF